MNESEKSVSFEPTHEFLLTQMKGISLPAILSVLGNWPNFLNSNSEFGVSKEFCVPNYKFKVLSGKANTSDFSFAQSNSSNAAVNITEKCSVDETYSEISPGKSQTQNGWKQDHMHLVPIDPSHSKTTSTAVSESIEYASYSNSSYISMVESINDENDEETEVYPNCDTVPKVDSPVAKLKAYKENVGSIKTKIPYQIRNNNANFKYIIKIFAKSIQQQLQLTMLKNYWRTKKNWLGIH